MNSLSCQIFQALAHIFKVMLVDKTILLSLMFSNPLVDNRYITLQWYNHHEILKSLTTHRPTSRFLCSTSIATTILSFSKVRRCFCWFFVISTFSCDFHYWFFRNIVSTILCVKCISLFKKCLTRSFLES